MTPDPATLAIATVILAALAGAVMEFRNRVYTRRYMAEEERLMRLYRAARDAGADLSLIQAAIDRLDVAFVDRRPLPTYPNRETASRTPTPQQGARHG